MMMTRGKVRIILLVLCCLGLLCLSLVLLPDIRKLIIWLTENFILQRQLENPAKWHNKMLFWSIRSILIFVLIFLIIIFVKQLKHLLELILQIILKLLNLVKQIINKIKQINTLNDAIIYITTINYRQFIKPTLIMFGIFTLGISAIIRANFLYIDDIGRSIFGYRGWGESWSRYISDFLAIIFHTDTHINDISPLTQIIAAFLIAASSVALVYVINDKKITKTVLAASLPVGFSPYFLECFSYKFDSPYMALSVLTSIIPFIFINNKLVFSISSIIGLLIMCMTYQASSGIYIIIVIFLCFQQWNTRQKTNQEILIFLGISIFSYCIAMILFKVFFMIPKDEYVSTSIYPLSRMISGTIHNITNYLRHIISDFNMIWKVFLLLVIFSFWIKSVILTKQSKLIAFITGFTVIILMSILSFGIYLVLTNPLYAPRGMYGIGIFIAIIGIYAASTPKKFFALPAFALCWCFFVFSFSYGNALAAQKTYIDFRNEMLLHDLAILFPDKSSKPQYIKILGTAGRAPVVNNISSKNKIITRLVPILLQGRWYWGKLLLTEHYNYNAYSHYYTEIEEKGFEREEEFEQIFDSAYHTINSNGEHVIVILK